MYDLLTKVDIEKMQAEIDQRVKVIRPKLVENLREARALGDLSENYEYKTAKQELRRCDSRIRHLRRMIETARVVEVKKTAGRVSMFDKVTIYIPDDDETDTVTIVTKLRQDSLNGYISEESPMARALMGKKVGDKALISVEGGCSYEVVIKNIESGEDDTSLPISPY